MLTLLQDKMDTPLGPLWVLCDEQFNLRAVEWDEHRDRMETLLDVHYRPVFEAKDSRTESAVLIISPYKQFVFLLVLLSQIRKGIKDLYRGLRRRGRGL